MKIDEMEKLLEGPGDYYSISRAELLKIIAVVKAASAWEETRHGIVMDEDCRVCIYVSQIKKTLQNLEID